MINELKQLWHTVFGDDFSIIDAYFDMFYSPELTAVEYSNGMLAAAAYVLPAGELINGKTREKCAHIYAVAVYPEFRGLGLGVSVTNKAVALAKNAGFTAIVLHPASESLFGYYEKHCGFSPCFAAQVSDSALPVSAAIAETDVETYRTYREKYLKHIPHIMLSHDFLTFFQKCGGKLYAFEGGCAAVEDYDGVSHIREKLGDFSEGINRFETCIISSPGSCILTGMIHGNVSFESGWMGLTLE